MASRMLTRDWKTSWRESNRYARPVSSGNVRGNEIDDFLEPEPRKPDMDEEEHLAICQCLDCRVRRLSRLREEEDE